MKKYYRQPLTAEELEEHKYVLSSTPAVYVGTYRKYNNGSIYGRWVDITSFNDEEDFIDFCKRLHADEENPEIMYQDYGGFPEAFYSESHVDFDKIIEYSNLSEKEQEAFNAYAEYKCCSVDIEDFNEDYMGEFDSHGDFAEYYCESTAVYDYDKLPKLLRDHIDWEGVWNELQDDFFENKGFYFLRH